PLASISVARFLLGVFRWMVNDDEPLTPTRSRLPQSLLWGEFLLSAIRLKEAATSSAPISAPPTFQGSSRSLKLNADPIESSILSSLMRWFSICQASSSLLRRRYRTSGARMFVVMTFILQARKNPGSKDTKLDLRRSVRVSESARATQGEQIVKLLAVMALRTFRRLR